MSDKLQVSIDQSNGTPLAQQIYNSILRQILHGELITGERLPTERDLALSLNVARGTVKRAYTKLQKICAIEIRKGSGSYVMQSGMVLEMNQKKEGLEIIAETFQKLESLGITRNEILNLIDIYCGGANSQGSKIKIIVLSNNFGILGELERQLSYLADSSLSSFNLSFMTIGSVLASCDPVGVLRSYHMIIATCIDYPVIMDMVPTLKDRLVEAGIAPTTQTLTQLSALPKNSHISVIYRTQVFRNFIHDNLLALRFSEKNIYYHNETTYNPLRHSENGVSVLINHNESPVFIAPEFADRNKEFEAGGGVILQFHYGIERKSLLYIEDRIQLLLKERRRLDF